MRNLRRVRRWVGIVAVTVAVLLAAGCGSDAQRTRDQEMANDVPLAALTYLWFGFDLNTGESIGGLKSSHWNTDVGNFGSRVGTTDEPEYGFYASDDPSVIAQQLADMEAAGISVLVDFILGEW